MNGYSQFAHSVGSLPGSRINNVYGIYDDFLQGTASEDGGKFSSTANKGHWLFTALTGTPTFIIKDGARGGYLQADTGAATDNHGLECQLNGESFAVTANKDIFFSVKWSSRNEVTDLDWVFGLSTTDTSVLATPGANFIGFTSGVISGAVLDGGTANVIARTLSNSGSVWTATEGTLQSSKDTGVDIVAGTDNVMSFWVQMRGENATVHFYIDDVEYFKTNIAVPDVGDALTPTFAAQNNGSTQGIMDIDYIYCEQVR